MKTLLLIRHAKSSWKDPALSDLQRPLKKRGEKNSLEMAERLSSLGLAIDRVLCSPANRAVETLKHMHAVPGMDLEKADILAELYSFDYGDVMRCLQQVKNEFNTIVVVGHNPAVTDLVNFLALENIRNIPTCGIALLNLDIRTWDQLKAGSGRLAHYDYPKNDPEELQDL